MLVLNVAAEAAKSIHRFRDLLMVKFKWISRKNYHFSRL